jgi:hypothetical protein
MSRALWTADRYNIQQLPLLRGKLVREFIDEDYRNFRTHISGILAVGAEYEKFSFVLKTASRNPGTAMTDPVLPANIENAWLFGADFELVPFENLRLEATGFAGINYEKTNEDGKNPANVGILAEYRMPLTDRYFLTPRVGFDFAMDTANNTNEWELGAGLLFHSRGYNYITSSRILDWAEVIPVGASLSMNMSNESVMNVLLSWFEPADRDSMLPNFGGFIQLELSDITNNTRAGTDYAVLAQLEYMVTEKITPYIRGGYMPEFTGPSLTIATTTGKYLVKGALGCFISPAHFFTIDARYELDLKDGAIDKNMFSTVFTIKM